MIQAPAAGWPSARKRYETPDCVIVYREAPTEPFRGSGNDRAMTVFGAIHGRLPEQVPTQPDVKLDGREKHRVERRVAGVAAETVMAPASEEHADRSRGDEREGRDGSTLARSKISTTSSGDRKLKQPHGG